MTQTYQYTNGSFWIKKRIRNVLRQGFIDMQMWRKWFHKKVTLKKGWSLMAGHSSGVSKITTNTRKHNTMKVRTGAHNVWFLYHTHNKRTSIILYGTLTDEKLRTSGQMCIVYSFLTTT